MPSGTATATGAATASAMASPVPVDHGHLGRFTLGNAELELEVLELFATHAPTYLLRLMAAESERDWYEAAHTLKGSARAIGAWQVAGAAERAEAIELRSDAGVRADAVEAVSVALDDVRRYVSGLSPAA